MRYGMVLDPKRDETAYPYRKPEYPVKGYDDRESISPRIRTGKSAAGPEKKELALKAADALPATRLPVRDDVAGPRGSGSSFRSR